MDFFQVAILSIIEGLTEFLPISSTAHLLLASRALGIPESDFSKTFVIAIQLGAIASVVVLYAQRIWQDYKTNLKVLTAFVPTAIIGFGLYKIIKNLLFSNIELIAWMLGIGGVLLIAFEKWHGEKDGSVADVRDISYQSAFLIGCAQALAVVPGVSRAGATIVGGMVLGLSRKAIVEFSFLLAIPTMAAATAYDLYKNANQFTLGQIDQLGLGLVLSFISAYFCVKFFLHYVERHSFSSFGFYRIILAVIVFSLL